ncbi:transposase [Klebsiella pneumoniae]|nr:transposase [Klebsiella pneumoniae]
MNVPLRCPDYTSVSKRAKSVNVSFKTFTRGEIAHLVIDSTGLKVFGSIAETAMYRVKQLFGGSLTLRDYDGQVAEAMALVRALNKMTKAGMPESVRIA